MKAKVIAMVVLMAGWVLADSITMSYTANNADSSVALQRSISGYTFSPGTNTWTYQRMTVTSATNHVVIGADVTLAGYAFGYNAGTSVVYLALGGTTSAFARFETNNPALFPCASTNLDVWTDVGRSGILELWLKNR